MENYQIKLLIIWPGYRRYNHQFFEILNRDKRFKIKVLWINDFRKDDPPPDNFLSSINWNLVGAKNIRISGYNLRTLIKMILSIWNEISHNDCVLTSTQAPLHSKVAFAFARLQKKKVFIKTEQWSAFSMKSLLMRQYKKFDTYLMRHCDMLFPHGTTQARFALSLGVHKNKISIMPFLSDDLSRLPISTERLRIELGLKDKKVLLYFGRITPQKGLSDLLEAFSMVHSRLANVVLLVCGGSDSYFLDYDQAVQYETQCRTMAKTMLKGKAIFTGPINPKIRQNYFALADLFVHPHTSMKGLVEGWGLVLNEAASMSLPIIATNCVGSAPDLVHHGRNGYIIEAGNIKQLAASIESLMNDDVTRQHFSLASRQVFEEYHKPSQIIESLLKAANG